MRREEREEEKVNKEDFASFQRGLAQAKAYLDEGAHEGYVLHDPIDVRPFRERHANCRSDLSDGQ